MNKKIILIIGLIFILVVVFVFFVIINKEEKKEESIKIERTQKQLAHPELLIEDIYPGKEKIAKEGDTVSVHYIGKLEDGTVFDSSYERGKPLTFTLGQGRVIQGWEIGIEGMREGGKRKLTIPPELGYGESGVRGIIPPNSTLIFEVELVEIK